jgi:hypothetical protein
MLRRKWSLPNAERTIEMFHRQILLIKFRTKTAKTIMSSPHLRMIIDIYIFLEYLRSSIDRILMLENISLVVYIWSQCYYNNKSSIDDIHHVLVGKSSIMLCTRIEYLFAFFTIDEHIVIERLILLQNVCSYL